ncbi:MAG: adenosylcobinamide-GDP ribazoletransferase [Thiohalocapsa sp.]
MDARRGPFDDFMLATAVLTRLPIGAAPAADGDVAAAGWAFPLVGVGVGAIAAIAFFLAEAAGLPELPAGLLAVLAAIGVTGALHEDGLADTVDGFGGGRSREAKLAIMRDSRHGTFGILALVLGVGLRAGALAAIGDPIHASLALVAAHTLSRGALPALMRLLPRARTDGLGAAAGMPRTPVAAVAAVLGLAIAIAMLGPGRGAAAILLSAVALAAAALLAYRQIGGYTGDVLGFFQQIGEIVMLLAAAAK